MARNTGQWVAGDFGNRDDPPSHKKTAARAGTKRDRDEKDAA